MGSCIEATCLKEQDHPDFNVVKTALQSNAAFLALLYRGGDVLKTPEGLRSPTTRSKMPKVLHAGIFIALQFLGAIM